MRKLLLVLLLSSCASSTPAPEKRLTYYCAHTSTEPTAMAWGASPSEAKDVMIALSCNLEAKDCDKRKCDKVWSD